MGCTQLCHLLPPAATCYPPAWPVAAPRSDTCCHLLPCAWPKAAPRSATCCHLLPPTWPWAAPSSATCCHLLPTYLLGPGCTQLYHLLPPGATCLATCCTQLLLSSCLLLDSSHLLLQRGCLVVVCAGWTEQPALISFAGLLTIPNQSLLTDALEASSSTARVARFPVLRQQGVCLPQHPPCCPLSTCTAAARQG
jgi:hypothetical protein